MNKVLLIMGDLATGKSTYANMLAKRYNCLLLSKDRVKEGLADTIGFTTREENKKLSKATFALFKYVFKQNALTHHDIILESNFHDDELIQFYQLIAKAGYESLSLVLKADVDILFKRFMNRATNENRHPVHLTEDLLDYDSFVNYITLSRPTKLQGKIIRMSANDFTYQNEENFAYFDSFFKGE